MELTSIGCFMEKDGASYIQVAEEYREGLTGINGFSHLTVLWWFDQCDNKECRNRLTIPKPYQKAPDVLGVFATRSEARPNPIALSVVNVWKYEVETGRIYVTYADAFAGTPVLDIKPYTPSIERVEELQVPDWCNHWPQSFEKSGEFDWEHEFLF